MRKPLLSRVVVLAIGVFSLGVLAFAQFSSETDNSPGVRETFEPAGENAPAAAPTWRVALGAAGVSTQASFGGAHALRLEPGLPPGQVTFAVPAEIAGGTFYVELRLLAGAPETETPTAAVAVTGAQAGLVRVGPGATIQVFDGTGEGAWKNTDAQWPTAGTDAPAQWVRLVLRIERDAGVWSLYVDGAPAAVNLPLDPAANQPLTLFGASAQPVFVDNVYIGADNPLTRDLFGPGPAGGPLLSGDNGTAATDGTSTSPGPLSAADDPAADPDHDGLTNAQEAELGTDKTRADNPAVGLVVFTPLQRSREQLQADRARATARRTALAKARDQKSEAATAASWNSSGN